MIWVFPKIVVPPNHPILIRISIINHPFWDTTIFGNIHIWWLDDSGAWRNWALEPPQKALKIIPLSRGLSDAQSPIQSNLMTQVVMTYQDWYLQCCNTIFNTFPLKNCQWPCQHILIMTESCFKMATVCDPVWVPMETQSITDGSVPICVCLLTRESVTVEALKRVRTSSQPTQSHTFPTKGHPKEMHRVLR